LFSCFSGKKVLLLKDGSVVAEPTYGQAEEEIYQTGSEGLTDIGAYMMTCHRQAPMPLSPQMKLLHPNAVSDNGTLKRGSRTPPSLWAK
jgi:hypothetical protein